MKKLPRRGGSPPKEDGAPEVKGYLNQGCEAAIEDSGSVQAISDLDREQQVEEDLCQTKEGVKSLAHSSDGTGVADCCGVEDLVREPSQGYIGLK